MALLICLPELDWKDWEVELPYLMGKKVVFFGFSPRSFPLREVETWMNGHWSKPWFSMDVTSKSLVYLQIYVWMNSSQKA
jgi:hypothetical protein